MALHTEASGNLVATEFRAAIVALGIAQTRVAELFDVGPRSVRRWQRGDRRVPRGVGIVLRLLAAGTVTIDQIEQVAVPVSAGRTAKRSLRLAVKTPALAAEAATFADSGLSTAEKVYELAANGCRWCEGDPQRPDFFFCDATTEKGPYCARHRARAYLTRSFTTLAGLPPTISSTRSAHLCNAMRTSSA